MLSAASTLLAAACLAAPGAGAQDPIPSFAPGPYAVGTLDWDFGRFAVTVPGSGGNQTLDVQHFGVVHYPASAAGRGAPLARGTFPFVVFAHGRFQLGGAVGTNHLQAAYLLDHLASHGFVAASVNLDVVGQYAQPAAIPQRAQLIHATIDAFERDPYGWGDGVDFSRIGLVGHSRGGDGCVRATYNNPGGNGIVAVATIAPTEFNQSIELEDVPYLSIYGSKDGDVSNGMPIRTYDRASGAPKAFEYVEGANHFWFTESLHYTVEGNADIARERHHDVARTYIAWFLFRTLGGPAPAPFAELCDGASLFPVTGEVAVHPIYSDPAALTINDFEDEPLDPEENSLGGDSRAGNLALVEEQWLGVGTDELYHRTNGLALAFAAGPPTPFYLEVLPSAVDATDYAFVSIDALQMLEGRANTPGAVQDLRAVLIDEWGARSFVRLSEHGTIPWPVTHDGPFPAKNVLRTTRLPLRAFRLAAPGIDLTRIRGVGLVLDQTPSGDLRIDGIRLTR